MRKIAKNGTIATGIKNVRQIVHDFAFDPTGKYVAYVESPGMVLVKVFSEGREELIAEIDDTILTKEDFWIIDELLKHIPAGKTLYIDMSDDYPLAELPDDFGDINGVHKMLNYYQD